jgi:hypothetical protein
MSDGVESTMTASIALFTGAVVRVDQGRFLIAPVNSLAGLGKN